MTLLAVLGLWGAATLFGSGPAVAEGSVSATATMDGRAIAGANAQNPVRLDPAKVTEVTVEITNGSANPVTIRRVDLAGHVLGLNFFSYSTSVELTVAAGKTEKLTYRLDPAGLDGQATGLIGSDLTLIGSNGDPITSVATVIDVRGSLLSVYGLFGIILAVLTALAITDAALTVARHRLAANRWQRGLRLLAPGVGIGLMAGFTASIIRWWVPGTGLWLALAGVTATVFFLAGYLSPTPRDEDDLGLDADELAAARELDAAQGYPAGAEDLTVAWNLGAQGYPVGGHPDPGAPRHHGPGYPGGAPDPAAAPGAGPPRYPVGRSGTAVFGPAVGGPDDVTIGRDAQPHKVIGDPSEEPTIRTGPGGTHRLRPGGAVG
ncbi:hypothetical protein [Nocardia crassostreae]|uniref:hypothetical protein n=1 Tax=Nocardia crassostreae TaxID=53428 RepID=UPI0012F747FA|nr:hypothetical protein [Nocardia crassostreae]